MFSNLRPLNLNILNYYPYIRRYDRSILSEYIYSSISIRLWRFSVFVLKYVFSSVRIMLDVIYYYFTFTSQS